MNLILWRHAEAEDQAASDLVRQLTPRGVKQAQAAAKWLKSRLDDDALFLVSPATRTIQTMEAFGDQYRVVKELAPGAGAQAVLDAAEWPRGVAETVVVVGHQPTLGRVAGFADDRPRSRMDAEERRHLVVPATLPCGRRSSRAACSNDLPICCRKKLQQATKHPPRRQNRGFAVTLH